jgi:hypothetical protein
MENTVRKVTVSRAVQVPDNNGGYTERPLNLIVGVEHTIWLDDIGTKVKRKISHIAETEKYLLVYLGDGSESQLWKKLPKNNDTIIEYTID